MTSSQKGSITTWVLVAIIIVLLVIGGVYVYENQKANAPASSGIPISANNGSNSNSSNSSSPSSQTGPASSSGVNSSGQVAVTGMQQYTDPEVGFSFWYPGNWEVTQVAPNINMDGSITHGTVLSDLVIGNRDSAGVVQPQILIEEIHSSDYTVTDDAGTDMNPTYFYSVPVHTWMTVTQGYNTPAATSAADVSVNTMGGLHMLGYEAHPAGAYTAIIIPLSAEDFLAVSKIGTYDASLLTKTMLALDPAVAVPWSAALQMQTVQAEAAAYAIPLVGPTWKSYSNSQSGISFQYPDSFGSGIGADMEAVPQALIVQSSNVDQDGCVQSISGSGRSGGDTQITLNNISFCLSMGGDPGMGQLDTYYNYTTYTNGEYVDLEYTVHTSNGCGVFQGSPEYVSCEYTFQNYSRLITPLIEQSAGTLKVIQ